MSSAGGTHSGFKSVSALEQAFVRRYQRVWADELVTPGCSGWPYRVSVGHPTMRDLEHDFAAWDAKAARICQWAQDRGLACDYTMRRVGRHTYRFVSHVVAADVVTLAAAVGRQDHLERYGHWLACLRAQFGQVDNAGIRRVLVDLNRYETNEQDFELVCQAAAWLSCHDVGNITARQVPLEGFHAKWLDAAGRRTTVCTLAGLERLEFLERPRLVRFRYLDGPYLERGGRMHDCWVEGDCSQPAYEPTTVVICENRDSALWFPELSRGIAILGDGMAGASVVCRIPWVAQAPRVLYWGDIDRQGFQILSKYRENGLSAQSMLMDEDTYARFERFGTHVDKNSHPIAPTSGAQALPGLTEQENRMYLRLCSVDFAGPRRIEQERIPLALARRCID